MGNARQGQTSNIHFHCSQILPGVPQTPALEGSCVPLSLWFSTLKEPVADISATFTLKKKKKKCPTTRHMTVLYSPIFLPWFVRGKLPGCHAHLRPLPRQCRFVFQFWFPLVQDLGNMSISRATAIRQQDAPPRMGISSQDLWSQRKSLSHWVPGF